MWDKLQAAQAHVVARVRTLIFIFGAYGVTEAHHISEELALGPATEVWLRRVFVVCMAISLLLRAGEKNDAKEQP